MSLKNKGQATVEYVLLLTVAVAIAALITKALVKRDPNEPGVLIERWQEVQKSIGKDTP
jgi:hypothetical protein